MKPKSESPAIPAGATLLSILDVVTTPRPRPRPTLPHAVIAAAAEEQRKKQPKRPTPTPGFDSILGLDSSKGRPNVNLMATNPTSESRSAIALPANLNDLARLTMHHLSASPSQPSDAVAASGSNRRSDFGVNQPSVVVLKPAQAVIVPPESNSVGATPLPPTMSEKLEGSLLSLARDILIEGLKEKQDEQPQVSAQAHGSRGHHNPSIGKASGTARSTTTATTTTPLPIAFTTTASMQVSKNGRRQHGASDFVPSARASPPVVGSGHYGYSSLRQDEQDGWPGKNSLSSLSALGGNTIDGGSSPSPSSADDELSSGEHSASPPKGKEVGDGQVEKKVVDSRHEIHILGDNCYLYNKASKGVRLLGKADECREKKKLAAAMKRKRIGSVEPTPYRGRFARLPPPHKMGDGIWKTLKSLPLVKHLYYGG